MGDLVIDYDGRVQADDRELRLPHGTVGNRSVTGGVVIMLDPNHGKQLVFRLDPETGEIFEQSGGPTTDLAEEVLAEG